MKFSRILALCLAVVMAALCLVSCDSKGSSVNITLNIKAGTNTVCTNRKVTVTAENPVVVDAINAAVEKFTDLNISLTGDGSRISSINEYTQKTVDKDTYYWSFTVNEKKPTEGENSKITTYTIKDGDVIDLVFYRFNVDDQKDYEYDAANDYQFGAEEEEEEVEEIEEAEEEEAAE